MRNRTVATLALAVLLVGATSPASQRLRAQAAEWPAHGRGVDPHRLAATQSRGYMDERWAPDLAPSAGLPTGPWYYQGLDSDAVSVGPRIHVGSTGTAPIAPLLLPIENPDGDPEYVVDWTDVPGVITYTLEEDGTPTFLGPSVRYAGPDSVCGIRHQPLGAWYCRVRAEGGPGSSPYSNVVHVRVWPRIAYLPMLLRSHQTKANWVGLASTITCGIIRADRSQGADA